MLDKTKLCTDYYSVYFFLIEVSEKRNTNQTFVLVKKRIDKETEKGVFIKFLKIWFD